MTEARQGVWAASITPFNADMSIDREALCAHVDWLLENGCDGVALLGTTGEANSLGVNERLSLIEHLEGRWPAERIMIGVGATAIPDTAALIHAAVNHEYPNVLMLPPFYYKNVPDDGIYQFVAEVMRRLGTAQPRVHLYDFPAMVGFPFSTGLIARLNDAFTHGVVGMKDSSGDFGKMTDVLGRVPGFAVYAGTEALLFDILEKGGAGCISATCNVTAPGAARVWEAWRQGDLKGAAKAQAALTAQREALQKWPLVPAVKAVLRRAFPDRVSRIIRPPLLNLSDLDRERLFRALDEIGFEMAADLPATS